MNLGGLKFNPSQVNRGQSPKSRGERGGIEWEVRAPAQGPRCCPPPPLLKPQRAGHGVLLTEGAAGPRRQFREEREKRTQLLGSVLRLGRRPSLLRVCLIQQVPQRWAWNPGGSTAKPILLPEPLSCTLTSASSPATRGTSCAAEPQRARHLG